MSALQTAERWNSFVAASTAPSFLQSWEWGEMQRQLGVPFWRIAVPSGGAPSAVSLVMRRTVPLGRSWLYAPRGPVVAAAATAASSWAALQRTWQELAVAQHAIFFRCDPAWPAQDTTLLRGSGWQRADRDVQPQETLLLDLSLDDNALLAAMHHKTRYNIRTAQRHGVAVRFSQEVPALESFLQLRREVEGRSSFRYHPEPYYRAMHAVLTPHNMLAIALAEKAGRTVAAHVLISFAGTVTYAHGASSSQERTAMAPHLLQWESIKWARAQGATQYDFFGVAPADAAADHPWAGITRFKLGFGGRREAYVGAYDLVQDSAAYSLFTFARRLRRVVL